MTGGPVEATHCSSPTAVVPGRQKFRHSCNQALRHFYNLFIPPLRLLVFNRTVVPFRGRLYPTTKLRAEVGVLAIAIVIAVCAASVLFFGYFVVALCKDTGDHHVVGYLLRIEPDRGSGNDGQRFDGCSALTSANAARSIAGGTAPSFVVQPMCDEVFPRILEGETARPPLHIGGEHNMAKEAALQKVCGRERSKNGAKAVGLEEQEAGFGSQNELRVGNKIVRTKLVGAGVASQCWLWNRCGVHHRRRGRLVAE